VILFSSLVDERRFCWKEMVLKMSWEKNSYVYGEVIASKLLIFSMVQGDLRISELGACV
jgi:hypothetical protein